MGQGVGGFVYLSDEDENVNKVSTAGRAYFSDSYTRIKNHSPINVSSVSGGSGFESAPVGKMYVRSESGNSIMWLGGSSNDAPYSGHGFPLFGGETSPILYVNDFTATRVCASISGQVIYAIGFLNGGDITLSQTSPVYPDITAPFIVSHSPVSGISGVALDSEITVTFSEPISPGTVVSGVLRLSPAHNTITFFRDETNTSKVVIRPDANLSGTTVYNITYVSGQITDLAGNAATSGLLFPFTTTNAPPPPDTTNPKVSGTTPVSGAQNVNVDSNITVTFSEAMLSGTINSTNIFIATTSGAGVGGIGATTVSLSAVDKKTVTVDPSNSLTEGNTYYINVTTGCQDLVTNPLDPQVRDRPFSTNYNFVELYNVTGTSTSDAYTGDVTKAGIEITDSSATVCEIIKRVVFDMRKVGSPTGTMTCLIRNAAKTIVATIGTIDVATDLTTSFQDITFTNLNQTRDLINGDCILFEWDGGNSSNKVEYRKVTSSVYSGARYITFHDGIWDTASQDIGGKVYK